MIYTTASDTYAVTPLTTFGRALIDDASTSAQRTTLGLAIGSDVQAFDAGLLSVAGLTTAADKMIYTTASDVYTTTDLTSYSRTLFDDVNAADWRTTLGVTGAADAINKDGSVAYTGTGDGFKDEDNMASDSAVATASQQSVKAYADVLGVQCWAFVDIGGTGAPTLGANRNVTSVVRTAAGKYTVTWATDFSTDQYVVAGQTFRNNSGGSPYHLTASRGSVNTAGIAYVETIPAASGTATDVDSGGTIMIMAVGTQ